MDSLKIARFEFSLFGINTYLVWNPATKECAVIDPGMINNQEEKAIDKFIENNNLKLTQLINTHLHIDHAIGNTYISRKYGISTKASSKDAFLGAGVRQQAAMYGIPKKIDDISISCDLKAGDIIHIGNGKLKVIEVPGHTPGGIALYDEQDGFVITGDSLFQRSIGRTDLPGGDSSQLIKSVTDNLLSLPDDTVVFPGHGPETTIGDEKKYNPFL